MKYSNNVQEWVAQWSMDAFKSISSDPDNFDLHVAAQTISIHYWGDDPAYKKRKRPTGIATCAPDDEFDLYTGVAIAWARLLKLPIPKELLAPPEFNAFSLVRGATFSFVPTNSAGKSALYKVLDFTTVNGTRSLFCEQISGRAIYPYVSFLFRREDNLRVYIY